MCVSLRVSKAVSQPRVGHTSYLRTTEFIHKRSFIGRNRFPPYVSIGTDYIFTVSR
nr:MAG TPA: hypothetical protein [Caudoviricetes sp.]